MKLDNVHHLRNDEQTIVLPKNPSMLYIEPQDNESEVFNALRQQVQPILLVLPEHGEVFSQPEHFYALQHLLIENGYPSFVHFLIPSRRVRERSLAAQYGFSSSTSQEEAFQTLAAHYFPQKGAVGVAHDGKQQISAQTEENHFARTTTTGVLPQIETPLPQNTSLPRHFSQKQHTFILLSVLAVVSIIVLPLLFLPTQSKTAIDRTVVVGVLSFTSSGQTDPDTMTGYNDILTLQLHSLTTPHHGMAYYVWLMPDKTDDETIPLLLGELDIHEGKASLTYAPPQHTNLLATYSGVRVVEDTADSAPPTPSQNPIQWRWEGWIPSTPTPGDEKGYSLLSHLRHLLAKDPTLKENNIPGGLAIWLTRNTAKVEEWASAAQGQWRGNNSSLGDADMIHKHMLRILEYLDGKFYYTRDVPVHSPWLVDPLAGKIGLLNSIQNQNPPGYLTHVDIHLTGLANSPGHTKEQNTLAIQVDEVINKMNRDLLQVRKDAAQVAQMNITQLRQPTTLSLLDDMANLTTEVKSGWFDAQTGENIGGVLWIESRLQQLAAVSIVANN